MPNEQTDRWSLDLEFEVEANRAVREQLADLLEEMGIYKFHFTPGPDATMDECVESVRKILIELKNGTLEAIVIDWKNDEKWLSG